jgi:hypothetical protein
MIFKALLLLFISASIVTGLDLSPVQVGAPIEYNFGVDIATQKQDSTALVTTFAHSGIIIPAEDMNKIASDIILAMEIDGSIVKHRKWHVSITQNIGTILMYAIQATISEHRISIVGHNQLLTQHIPTMYETHEQCQRSGRRRYGIAGPRRNVCHTYTVQRGLYPEEINQIQNALTSKASELRVQFLGK